MDTVRAHFETCAFLQRGEDRLFDLGPGRRFEWTGVVSLTSSVNLTRSLLAWSLMPWILSRLLLRWLLRLLLLRLPLLPRLFGSVFHLLPDARLFLSALGSRGSYDGSDCDCQNNEREAASYF